MPFPPLLRVLSVLVALLLCPVESAIAAEFPSLSFHETFLFFPSAQQTITFCDALGCSADVSGRGSARLPRFGLIGRTLLTAEFSYDVQLTADQVAHNNAAVSVISSALFLEVATFFGIGSVYSVSDFGFTGLSTARVLPGQSTTLIHEVSRVTDSLVLLPGDVPFSAFLGSGELDLLAGTEAEQRASSAIPDCAPSVVFNCEVTLLAPISVSTLSAGTVDLTYRYCTPGVDLGCPDAIPGFNSPVAAPATLFLFALGFVVVMAGAACGSTAPSADRGVQAPPEEPRVRVPPIPLVG
jgi:hypothetical protein